MSVFEHITKRTTTDRPNHRPNVIPNLRPNMTKEKSVNFNLIEIRTTLGIMLGLTLGLGNKAPLQTLVYQNLAIPTLGC